MDCIAILMEALWKCYGGFMEAGNQSNGKNERSSDAKEVGRLEEDREVYVGTPLDARYYEPISRWCDSHERSIAWFIRTAMIDKARSMGILGEPQTPEA